MPLTPSRMVFTRTVLTRTVLTRTVLTRYGTAWVYLVCFSVAEIVYALLSTHDQAAVIGWASTNVHNLGRDPVGCVIASAFVTQEFAWAWPALIAVAMFSANRVLGNWRTALVCAAGHVIGTLVSEGIQGYRVAHGLLPASGRFIVDVGPSYVVVSAITVAVLYGPWLLRVAAAFELFLLVYIGDIFGGLSTLVVSAVGHATAIAVSVVLGSLLVWQQWRRRRRRLLREGPAPAAAG
jgi:hypothetical protein